MIHVLGFLFSKDLRKLVLIRKNRPNHLAGKLNGVGGKVEKGELHVEALSREFREETGAEVPENHWRYFCRLERNDGYVQCYMACGNYDVTSKTDEEVAWYLLPLVNAETGPRCRELEWLIPLALDPEYPMAQVKDQYRICE